MRATALGLVLLVACGPAAVSAVPGTGPATEAVDAKPAPVAPALSEDLYHREQIRRSFEEFFNRTDQEQAILNAKINASVQHHRDLVHQEITLLNTLLQAEGGSSAVFANVKTPNAAAALNAKSDEEVQTEDSDEAEHDGFVTIRISDTHKGEGSTAETWVEQNGDGGIESANAERGAGAAEEDAGDQTELATSMEKELALSRVDGANDEDEIKRWLAANKARRDGGARTAAQEAVGKRELAFAEGRAAAAAAILARVKAEAEEAETNARGEEELAKKWAKEAEDKRMAASQREAEARQAFAQLAEVRGGAKDTASNGKAKHLEEVASKVLNAATAVQNAANELKTPMTDNRTAASGASFVVEERHEGGREGASIVKGAEEMVLEKEKELVRAREKLASAKIDEQAKTLEAEEDKNQSSTLVKYPQRTLAPTLAKVMNDAIAGLDSDQNESATALQYAAAEAEEADKASEVAEMMLESEKKSAADIEALEAEEARTVKHGAIVKMEMEKAKARMAAQKKEAAIAALHASFLKAEAESVAAVAAHTAAVAKRDMAAADATWANHEIVNLIAEAGSEADTDTLERSRRGAWELSAKKPKMALFAGSIAEDSAVKAVDDEFTKTSATSKVAQRAQARLEAAKQVQAAAKADLQNAVKTADKAMAIAKTEQEMATRAEASAASAKQHQEQAEEAARAARAQSEWAQHTAQTWILEGKKTADDIKKVTEKIQEANATAAAALANANAAAKMNKEAAKTRKVEKAMADLGLEEANAQMSKTADKKAALGKADQEVEAARLMLAKIVHMDKKKELPADKKAQDAATPLAQKHHPERGHHRDAEVSMRTKTAQDLNASWVESVANWVFGKPPAHPDPVAKKGKNGRKATSLAKGERADEPVKATSLAKGERADEPVAKKGRKGRKATSLARGERAHEPVAKNGTKGREAISLAKHERVVKRAAKDEKTRTAAVHHASKLEPDSAAPVTMPAAVADSAAPVTMPVAVADSAAPVTMPAAVADSAAPVTMPAAVAETPSKQPATKKETGRNRREMNRRNRKGKNNKQVASDAAAPNASGFEAWSQEFLAQGAQAPLAQGGQVNATTPMPPLPAEADTGKVASDVAAPNASGAAANASGFEAWAQALFAQGGQFNATTPMPSLPAETDTGKNVDTSGNSFLGARGTAHSIVEDGSAGKGAMPLSSNVKTEAFPSWAGHMSNQMFGNNQMFGKPNPMLPNPMQPNPMQPNPMQPNPKPLDYPVTVNSQELVKKAKDTLDAAMAAQAEAEKAAQLAATDRNWVVKAADAWLNEGRSKTEEEVASTKAKVQAAEDAAARAAAAAADAKEKVAVVIKARDSVKEKAKDTKDSKEKKNKKNKTASFPSTAMGTQSSPFAPLSAPSSNPFESAPGSPWAAPVGSHSLPPPPNSLSLANTQGSHRRTYEADSFSPEASTAPPASDGGLFGALFGTKDSHASQKSFSSSSSPYSTESSPTGLLSSFADLFAPSRPVSSPSSPYPSRRDSAGSTSSPRDPYAAQAPFSSPSSPYSSRGSTMGSADTRADPYASQNSLLSSRSGPHSSQSSSMDPYASQKSYSSPSSPYGSASPRMGSMGGSSGRGGPSMDPYASQKSYSSPSSPYGSARGGSSGRGGPSMAVAPPPSDGGLFGAFFAKTPKNPNPTHEKSRDTIQMEKRKKAERAALKNEEKRKEAEREAMNKKEAKGGRLQR